MSGDAVRDQGRQRQAHAFPNLRNGVEHAAGQALGCGRESGRDQKVGHDEERVHPDGNERNGRERARPVGPAFLHNRHEQRRETGKQRGDDDDPVGSHAMNDQPHNDAGQNARDRRWAQP